jgi:hypothetical protein
MGSVYGGGILNIAATGFPDGQNGLYSQRDCNVMTPIRVVAPEDIDVLFNPENEDRQGALAKSNYVLVDAHEWRYGVDDSPLCKRGWVTQERALSVRTVHFGNQQLFWECSRMRRSEVHPRGFIRGVLYSSPKTILFPSGQLEKNRTKKLIRIRDKARKKRVMEQERTESQRNLRLTERNSRIEGPNDHNSLISARAERKPLRITLDHLNITHRDFHDCDAATLDILDGLEIEGWEELKDKLVKWGYGKGKDRVKPLAIQGSTIVQLLWRNVIESFSGCKLSFSDDILVAISGCARSIARDMNCAYLAGMWRRDLEHQLLWRVRLVMKSIEKDGLRAPTWSWASVDSPVRWASAFNPL